MHYLGLLRIEVQAALFKATGQNFLQMFRLRLAHAMTYRVIGIAFKWYMRVMDAHPLVERVSPPSLHAHYRHFSTTTGQSATEEDFGTFLPCSSLSAFPLTFRLLLPTFRQQACITVLPPLCRMPQCHRQVIALLVARTVRH